MLISLGDSTLDDTFRKEAVRRIFKQRGTALQNYVSVGVSEDCAESKDKAKQWQALLLKNKLDTQSLDIVTATVREKAMRLFCPVQR